MSSQLPAPIHFNLVPFTASPSTLSITGSLAITGGDLEVVYRLKGDLDSLNIAPEATTPERCDLLWQTTCLELFLAHQGAPNYWEFNLSPAGHWNVYHLEGYRQGLAPEPAYRDLAFAVQREEQQLSLQLRCPIPPKLAESSAAALEAGITAVVEHGSGKISYWALNHPAPAADFHHRGGFALILP